MAAIGTGVAMVGATLTGAMALDLADYPSPYVVDGVYDDTTAFVVGDQASAADSLGVADVVSGLQFESKVATSEAGTTVSVEGGKTEKVPLGSGLTASSLFDTTLQDDDVSSFWDGEITFQGSSYDTSEELQMETTTDPVMATSLTSSEDDYKTDVYMEVVARDVIKFAYKFDETINLTSASTTQPLTLDFLGNTLKITTVPLAGTQFTAYVGEEHYLSVDETAEVEVDGVMRTVTLTDVSSSSAVVDVDGVSEIISDDSTETVNGVEITVDEVFSRTERDESSANLIIGKESSETYKDGDAYIGEDKDDPNWVWDIAGLETQGTSQTFRVENDFLYNDLNDGGPAIGDCIELPNAYVEICVDSLTVADADYAVYTMEFDSSTDFTDAGLNTTYSAVPSIYWHTSVDEGFDLQAYTTGGAAYANETAAKKTKEVWLYKRSDTGGGGLINGSDTNKGEGFESDWLAVLYKDAGTSKIKLFGYIATNASTEIVRINYGNTKDTNLVLKTSTGYATDFGEQGLNFTLEIKGDSTTDLANDVDDMVFFWGLDVDNGSIDSLGATASSEEALEIKWGGSNTTLGTKDEDHRTRYGIVLENPKSNGASDQIEMKIPQDQVMANVVIKGSSTTVTSGSSSYTSQEISPVTKLASEISSASTYNLIIVGGPCANDLVEDVFDLTCDGWDLEEGEAMLKLVENGDNVALLVAGTVADDTRRAAKALAGYSMYDLSGAEVKVSGTSVDDVNVGTLDVAEAEEEVAEEEAAEETTEEETTEE